MTPQEQAFDSTAGPHGGFHPSTGSGAPSTSPVLTTREIRERARRREERRRRAARRVYDERMAAITAARNQWLAAFGIGTPPFPPTFIEMESRDS